MLELNYVPSVFVDDKSSNKINIGLESTLNDEEP